jgi:antitoxin component YwqK of YwqJK toxin-antitoxin module
VGCIRIYHKTGEHKFWDEDGKLIKKLIFEDDEVVGEN